MEELKTFDLTITVTVKALNEEIAVETLNAFVDLPFYHSDEWIEEVIY